MIFLLISVVFFANNRRNDRLRADGLGTRERSKLDELALELAVSTSKWFSLRSGGCSSEPQKNDKYYDGRKRAKIDGADMFRENQDVLTDR